MAAPRLSLSRITSMIKDNNTKPKEAPTNTPSETSPSRTPERLSEDTASSSAAITALAANVPGPTADTLKTLQPSKISLWDRAYDSLKARDEKLVKAYEQLLSKELQTITSRRNGVQNNDDENHAQTENQIENHDHEARLMQLEKIAHNGLKQLEENKAKYSIFGHEFILRDQLAQATQFIQTIKDAIDVAVKASPEASLAWAGFCVILPIFMNPGAAEEASRDGCLYVTSRINFYVKLETLLLASSTLQGSGLRVDIEDRLITLYQLIIEFQIRTVRRVYLTRLKRLKEDTVRRENWKDMITKIQELEKMVCDDFQLVKDATMGATLEELNINAEKLFKQIDSLLVSLIKNSGDISTFYFQNAGSGNQFNVTEGIQYNAMDKSMQFNGGIFNGAVTFN